MKYNTIRVFLFFVSCLAAGLSFSSPKIRNVQNFVIMNNNKEQLKNDQWKLQQEILARRKNKSQMKSYFEKVEERRKEVSKEMKSRIWKDGDEDPLPRWLEAKKQGKIKPLGYEPEPSREDSKLGLNIIIPLNPIGLPNYDDGERFDLRLPYAETGYVDPESDIVSKVVNGIKNLFGPKKPKDNEPTPQQTSKGKILPDKKKK